MNVLFATSECVPFFKKGGLGDVSHGLPIALSKIGIHPVVTLPFYHDIKIYGKCRCLGQIAVEYQDKKEQVFIFQTAIPKTDVPVILFRHKNMKAYEKEAFPFYSLCVSELYLRSVDILRVSFDILHCHDWHTALIPILLGEEKKGRKEENPTLESTSLHSIFTIHNLLYEGTVSVDTLIDVGLHKSSIGQFLVKKKKHTVELMREILRRIDVISTVSPTYGREITTSEYGGDVSQLLKERKSSIVGILNGIDTDVWNSKTDKLISRRYGKDTVHKVKPWNKRKLQREVGLPITDDFLFGFIGRIEPKQKGIALIMEAISNLPQKHFQVVVLGSGDSKQVKELEALCKVYDHIVFVNAFDEKLARRIYAGCDGMLIPSRFEPCGLIQMIAMRYGTVPVVRKTGGLTDSVRDRETGFVFQNYTVEDLTKAMWQAVVMREDEPKDWQAMVLRCMREDFSWGRSAMEYKALYSKLLSSKL